MDTFTSPADRPLAGPARNPSLWKWIVNGLRAAVFLKPQGPLPPPAPWQMLAVVVLMCALDLGLLRLAVGGPAVFDLQAWLSNWWGTWLGIALAWWVLCGGRRTALDGAANDAIDGAPNPAGGLAAFVILWLLASTPPAVVVQGLVGAISQEWLKLSLASSPYFFWGLYAVHLTWSLATGLVLMARFAGWGWRVWLFTAAMLAASALSVWQLPARAWQPDESADTAWQDRPRLQLSQEVFQAQEDLWQRTADGLAEQRPGVTDVYGLVFAPYAPEDVFLRESTLVADVLASRFDAQGRVVQLLNNAATTDRLPWATTLNLERAIEAIAAKMDRENDVLVVYLTSHGASNFQLAASHWPLETAALTPAELRSALDKAGIRHRVIAVSACYSGGWVEPLASEDTLVMTAADATHTSYGCGRLSPLTFFGRALFDEQLRSTHSFEKAFAAAVPVIRQREIEGGKTDGFSNPQIRVGPAIARALRALEARLDALPQPVAPAR
ncbi:MAG: C13 family peptidase [Polaromonas sp.]|nr:C13 family peptidase [Polaromonas sp.]